MKTLLVGDIHLSDKPPSIRTDAYLEQILDKLEQTVTIATEEQVDAVAWAGDVFHVKVPSRTSHFAVRRTVEIGQKYGVPWFIVPGNHDVQHDRLDFKTQPLGVLYRAGAIPLMGYVGFEKGSLFGVPWLQDWKELPKWLADFNRDELDTTLIVTHCAIMPPKETVPYEYIPSESWAELITRKPAAVYYGHIHDLHGDYEVDGVNFCNQGSISRGSLHESSLKRVPAVTIHDDTDNSFKRIELDYLPAEEVFRLGMKADVDERQERLNEFATSVETTTLDTVSVESILLVASEESESVQTLLAECVEEAVHG